MRTRLLLLLTLLAPLLAVVPGGGPSTAAPRGALVVEVLYGSMCG